MEKTKAKFLPQPVTWEEERPIFKGLPQWKCVVGYIEAHGQTSAVTLLKHPKLFDLGVVYYIENDYTSTRPAAEAIRHIDSKFEIEDVGGQWRWLKDVVAHAEQE